MMKILIAEDDPISLTLLRATLGRWGYDVITARDGIQALKVLQREDAPKLAILDWMMPDMDGVEVCQNVRQIEGTPYIYIILLTSKSENKDLIEGMSAGADDYITKPFDPPELEARLRAGKRIIDLQTKLLETQKLLRHQVSYDALTGLYNRAIIMDILHHELLRSARENTAVSVIMADLDHFKQVNDTYGHIAGDDVLRETSRRIRSSLRNYEMVGRYGGEEFLMVLSRCDDDEASIVGERIRKKICEEAIDISGQSISVTISLGTATSHEGRFWDMNTLIKIADAALYKAKENGRNRVEAGCYDLL